MTVEITDDGGSVIVTYKDGSGNSAKAIVVGESAESVRDRAQEIVDAHNLKEKATA